MNKIPNAIIIIVTLLLFQACIPNQNNVSLLQVHEDAYQLNLSGTKVGTIIFNISHGEFKNKILTFNQIIVNTMQKCC